MAGILPDSPPRRPLNRQPPEKQAFRGVCPYDFDTLETLNDGSPASRRVEYGRRLTERQDAEIAAYERTKVDLERAKETISGNALINYWESQNDKLRNLGIRPLTLESLE